MTLHYDPKLKDRFPANNSSSDIVLNERFAEWNGHIEENLISKNRFLNPIPKYETEEATELLRVCQEHVKENKRPIEADIVIILGHPLYLLLTHMDRVKTPLIRKEVDEYTNKLFTLLGKTPPHDRVGLVILETLHHYAAATSLLLELGLIDKVIFTLYDEGIPLDSSELEEFNDKVIFVGGNYNKRCLEYSIKEIKKIVNSEEQIWAIYDLILNAPKKNSKTLKPKRIYTGSKYSTDRYFPDTRVISLNEVMKRLYV